MAFVMQQIQEQLLAPDDMGGSDAGGDGGGPGSGLCQGQEMAVMVDTGDSMFMWGFQSVSQSGCLAACRGSVETCGVCLHTNCVSNVLVGL